ncbi:MAG TPA: right-handed parallel beta-helix repeat-containing protein, partial [Candidatus Dormibacteraeota bacterium]|nr:right-handed parallel beta-helix repeat-containing protein [Candidatus Dormibacteraeota bacterium]
MLRVSRYVLVLLLGASAHGAELAPPAGRVRRVANTEQLFAAVEEAKPGDTILVEPGHYWLARRLRLQVDRLALRGATGQRERVILDGQRSQDGELLALQACSDVTIADLTIQNVRHNGIKINSDSNVQRVTVHNCVLHNIWQRAVKGVKVPLAQRATMGPGDCRIEYCLFYNDRPKEFSDDPADTPDNFQGNYVGGIDVMFARNWLIHDNVFVGIQGRTRSGRGAIFLWHEAENCVVERNILVDCDVGIALGNSYKPAEVSWHARRCVVRNNFVTRAPESGIVADYTSDCQILHNTIHDPTNHLGRLIRLVHDNPGLLVANNLLSGPPLRNESSSTMALRQNPAQDCTAFFVNPAAGDLHLRKDLPESLGPSDPGASVEDDIDRQNRRQPSRPGADQFRADDAGEVLHNGIMLPREWPPRLAEFPTSVETDPVVPPYLTSPPPVITIDVGRQLFVDDFLIAETTLARTFHLATYHPANPVVQPDKPWETKDANRAAAMVFSDGVWYDPKEGLFKMWYLVGEDAATGYATSSDGIHWNKPSLDVRPPTNIVQPGGRDSSTVWLDLEEKDPARRYKMFRVVGGGEDPVTGWNNWVMAIHFSADGVHWGEPVAKTGRLVDRSTVFWNPFRQVWVYSIRHVYRTGGAQDKSYGFARRRSYVEGRDVLAAARWEVNEPLRWIDVDRLDPVRDDLQVKPQLYNLDAVAYESLLVGFFTVWRGQPADRHKPNHVVLGYSRDGW